jgi:hypothetical protein
MGWSPSGQLVFAQKLHNVVNVPEGLILKTVPSPFAPPNCVVP